MSMTPNTTSNTKPSTQASRFIPTLYTLPTCNPCKVVKAKLEELGIEHSVIDFIDDFPAEVKGVPALKVNDHYYIGLPTVMQLINKELS